MKSFRIEPKTVPDDQLHSVVQIDKEPLLQKESPETKAA